jgi:hypothetical protein
MLDRREFNLIKIIYFIIIYNKNEFKQINNFNRLFRKTIS